MDTITTLQLDVLHESPFNPRKLFDDAALQELATDIKSVGRVLQPLLVRPRIPPLFAGQPDDEAATCGYEIVFGHRRYRAAALAGLSDVPCMVRIMSDDEARRAQISENLQRTDVHPIEEAEGFQALIDAGSHTADSIAAEFGKSRSYVYGRLKLLEACPEIRKACLAGEVGSEVALLIARLRTTRLQEKALGYIRADYHCKMDDGGKASYRNIRNLLAEKFTLDLKSAMFDIEDEMLLPSAGHCLRCPKRTGNAPEYADLAEATGDRDHGFSYRTRGGADICTDPDCFAAKKTAHLKREADKLAAAGKVVVDGTAARNSISAQGIVKGAYVALADVQAELAKQYDKAKSASEMVKAKPTVVLIQDPRTGKTHKAVKVADLKAAGVKVKEPAAKPANSWEAQEAKRKEEQRRNQLLADDENVLRLAVLQRVREHVAHSERDAFDLRLVAHAAIEGVEWGDRDLLNQLWGAGRVDAAGARHTKLEGMIDTMSVADLTRLLMDCGLVRNLKATYHDHKSPPQVLYAMAEHYGIDVRAIRAEVAKGASTPATAARAADKAAPAARGVRYRCPDTGSTWSGKGLQPAWLKASLAKGRTLAEFDVKTTAAKAASEQNDDAGFAGGQGGQVDAFEEAEA